MIRDFFTEYKKELIQLNKNEDSSTFFYDILVKNIRIDRPFVESLLLFLEEYCRKNILLRTENGLSTIKAWLFHMDRKYEESIDIGLESYFTAEQYGDVLIMSKACNILMSNYAEIGLIDIANEWGIKGIEFAKRMKNERILYSLYINMAIGYMQIKDYFNAKNMLDNIEHENLQGSNEAILSEYQLKAEYAVIKKNLSDAKKYLDKISAFPNQEEYSFCSAETKRLWALYYKLSGNDDLADDYFNEGILSSKGVDSIYYCTCVYSYSEFLYEKGKIVHAKSNLLECIKVAEKERIYYVLLDAYDLLVLLYENDNNYFLAYKYLDKITKLREKLSTYKTKKYYEKVYEMNVEREVSIYKKLYDRLFNLSELGKQIISTFEIDEIISILDQGMRPLMVYNVFSLLTYDSNKDLIISKYFNHVDGKKESEGDISEYTVENVTKTDTLTSYCIKNKKEILINDIGDLDNYISRDTKYYIKMSNSKTYRSFIFVPLMIKDNLIGLLTVQSYQKNAYSINDVNTLNILSNYVSIALENSNIYKRIENIAKHDSLTGLYTRSEMINLCEQYIKSKDFKNHSLVMIDIDKFKIINDTFGHIQGDNIIRKVADIMKSKARSSDYIGRYGGDEFVLFLPNTNKKQAYDISERIRLAVNEKYIDVGQNDKFNISISMGIFSFDEKYSFEDSLKFADEALYIAKNSGGNAVYNMSVED